MTKLRWYHVFEIALSCLCAIALAQILQLQNSLSAGIIAILSIQSTKKRTLALAFERGIFFIIALSISYISFSLLGYNLFSFSLFVLIFAAVCYWKDGVGSLSLCCVLISHFLIAKTMALSFIINEALLLVVGVGFGILFNLFTPDSVASIRKTQQVIEEDMRTLLTSLSALMQGKKTSDEVYLQLTDFQKNLSKAQDRAHDYQENMLMSSSASYYIFYMHMRENQYQVLLRIFENAKDLEPSLPQIPLLAAFFENIAATFHERNNAQALLEELDIIKEHYKNSPLPKTRPEFEQRATLYRILVETQQFLQIKLDFVLNLTKNQQETFLSNINA